MLFRKSELRAGMSIPGKEPGQEEETDQAVKGRATRSRGRKKDSIRGVGLKQLRQVIGELQQGEIIPFATGGQWSNHDLLEFILERTGPADVYITTWSLTEEPVRAILDFTEKGLIRSLTCLFDYRIQARNPKVFQLIDSVIERKKLTKIHAKVTVICNEEWAVSIISSANFTKNPRIEAGVILTDTETAAFNIDWIEEEILNEQPLKFKRTENVRRDPGRRGD
ncbi:hypothetical protein EFA69_16160 [Rufibacter immobilis]|uniref:Phospholipase D-like domain-containing protein n=1 Tax=Rufibacter immobilis TaxID=1348778 RepID=A0A3M9MQ78_9BACT|nr:hypothetical protein [Rufibacter immobilis]RNI27651.1 hypothetical protein EFA69_16160 [Rufibacter immobilis]